MAVTLGPTCLLFNFLPHPSSSPRQAINRPPNKTLSNTRLLICSLHHSPICLFITRSLFFKLLLLSDKPHLHSCPPPRRNEANKVNTFMTARSCTNKHSAACKYFNSCMRVYPQRKPFILSGWQCRVHLQATGGISMSEIWFAIRALRKVLSLEDQISRLSNNCNWKGMTLILRAFVCIHFFYFFFVSKGMEKCH